LDDLNEFPAHHLRLKLAEPSHEKAKKDDTTFDPAEEIGDAALLVNLLPQENTAATPRSQLQAASSHLDIFYSPSQVPAVSSSTSPLVKFIAGEIQKLFIEEKATIAYILHNSNLGGANTGLQSVDPQLTESISRRHTRSFKYADTYHLTFSLFTPGSEPSSWDIEAAIDEYVAPLLDAFSSISNFSVDTQVQLFASFSPTAPRPEFDEAQQAWTLKEEDLSAFVNAAEWPLSPSIGSGPTINFVLYVPAPSQSPMVVKGIRATSWIAPQWGGVAIVNPPLTADNPYNPAHLTKESLHPAFSTFSHQLLSLMGVPSSPSSLSFRLQTLTRIRTATLLLSASSTMGSLARLTQSLGSIPIPITVASSVASTLSHLQATCDLLKDGQFTAALASARIAEKEAEKSFFEKSMVGQVYFPEEHKVAVYLPLLGPIGVPLAMGLVKELKRIIANFKKR
jgi:phosphatidylinositol glycan class S